MARIQQSVVYMDTHIVVWLYAGLAEKLSERVTSAIEEYQVLISQSVKLELQYLFVIKQVKIRPLSGWP